MLSAIAAGEAAELPIVIKTDVLVDYLADKLGVPASVRNTAAERAVLMEEMRNQQQQQANYMMANMMPQMQGMIMAPPQQFAGMAATQFQNNGFAWGQGQNSGGNMGRNF